MIDDLTQSVDREGRLDEAVASYLQAAEGGRAPDRREWLARYPDVAGELEHFFAGNEQFDRLAAPLRLLAPPASGVTESDETGGLGRLGDFQLTREVGRGGMGVVYEAEQISLRRRVALKTLPFAATMDPRRLQRFENEARAAASLHHPNIVPVYAVGSDRGVRFYAMQFVDGQTLAELIAAHRQGGLSPSPTDPYSPASVAPTLPAAKTTPKAQETTSQGPSDAAYYRRVAEWGVQAAEALEHAHAVGIVHRDIKPGNLMIDGGGNLWVTDFGLARIAADAGLTMTGDVLGTLRYTSPEQALAKHGLVDHRTDVYSLGATLYELATSEPAVGGKDRAEIFRRITLEDPIPLRAVDRTVPAELEVIVLKAMAKEPHDRYATAQDLADDLRRWLEDRPILARRPSLLQKARRWARRYRAAVTSAAVCLLLVVAVLAGSVGWVVRDRGARRDDAERRAGDALRSAEAFMEQENWPEGLRSVEQAEGFLAGFEGETALRLEVRQLRRDLEMAGRLQEAEIRMAAGKNSGGGDFQGSDAAYTAAFREYGLDVDGLDPEAEAERVQAQSIRGQLVAALDDWAYIRRQLKAEGWKQRLAVSRVADPDRWRNRLRDALEGKDPKALEEVAAAGQAEDWPVPTLKLLGTLARGTASGERVAALLGRAQQRHPNDFWINEILGEVLHTSRPRRLEEEIRFFTVAVALRPQSPGARLNLGAALEKKGRLDEAIAEFREAIRLDKDYVDAHYNLGVALGRKGQLDEAIAEYRKAIRLDKDHPHAHYNLGVALGRKGQLDEAIAEFREAIRLEPNYAKSHYNLGVALEKGRLDEAIAEFREAIRLDKDLPEPHNNLGNALLAKGRLDEAIAEFREAIRLEKDYPTAHYNLGIALLAKGRLDEAIAQFREAIRLNKDFPAAHDNLGGSLQKKGQLDEAIAEHREAIRLDKDYPQAHNNLGNALEKKGRLDEAIAEFREAIRLDKDYPQAHNNLGNALEKKGRLDEAIAEFREAIRLEKDLPASHYNLGTALLAKGRLDEAIAEFREAIRLDKDYVDAHCNLGVALGRKGQLDEAIAEYRKAIRLDKDHPQAHCNLGNDLGRKGKFREAVEQIRLGHELGSRNPRWPYPSAQWLRDAERRADLDARLPNLLAGKDQPADFDECLALAQMCQIYKHLYAASARWYAAAFALRPGLADDSSTGHRYNAACAAALAGCGRGKDAGKLDDKERARLRKQALDWLRADLTAWRSLLDKGPEKARPAIVQQLRHWQKDDDLAGVRDKGPLARLPEAERTAWQQLWADVVKALPK